MTPVLAFQIPGIDQSLVILVIGLLLFGKRLPEVGRSLGKGIVEFKKGIKGIEEEVEQASTVPATPTVKAALPAPVDARFDPYTGKPIEQVAPKFDPYTGKPIEAATAHTPD